MPLLFHRRDVTTDATEGVCSGCGAKATTDLLLDFHHPQIPLGQIVVKGYGKVFHKSQRFGLVLHPPVQQMLAGVLFLAPTLPTGERRGVVLFFHASLQERSVAWLVVSALGGGQCRLRLCFGDIPSSLDLDQQRLHLPGPRPLPLRGGEDQLPQVVCVAPPGCAVVLPTAIPAHSLVTSASHVHHMICEEPDPPSCLAACRREIKRGAMGAHTQ